MATITLRDVPEELHARLKERAARNRRSLNSEIIRSLEQSVSVVREEPQAYLDSIRSVREKTKAMPLSDELLRKAREEGRS